MRNTALNIPKIPSISNRWPIIPKKNYTIVEVFSVLENLFCRSIKTNGSVVPYHMTED